MRRVVPKIAAERILDSDNVYIYIVGDYHSDWFIPFVALHFTLFSSISLFASHDRKFIPVTQAAPRFISLWKESYTKSRKIDCKIARRLIARLIKRKNRKKTFDTASKEVKKKTSWRSIYFL